MTNTSLWSRAALARYGESVGMRVSPDRIWSALSVSAAYTRRRFEHQPLYVLASEDARSEFVGQWLLSNAEAAARGAHAAAVVVGDSPEEATYGNLNAAFRLLRGGAELIGMHKNRWWITGDGPTLDSGAFVAGLEFASGRKAVRNTYWSLWIRKDTAGAPVWRMAWGRSSAGSASQAGLAPPRPHWYRPSQQHQRPGPPDHDDVTSSWSGAP